MEKNLHGLHFWTYQIIAVVTIMINPTIWSCCEIVSSEGQLMSSIFPPLAVKVRLSPDLSLVLVHTNIPPFHSLMIS